MDIQEPLNISVLAGDFKTHAELREYSNKQYIALQKAANEIKKLSDEIEHLKYLLENTTKILGQSRVERVVVSPEQAICEKQIDLLQDRAMTKELTLEEVKRLDLLIKNLRLIREQATTIPGEAKHISTLSRIDLLKIASSIDETL